MCLAWKPTLPCGAAFLSQRSHEIWSIGQRLSPQRCWTQSSSGSNSDLPDPPSNGRRGIPPSRTVVPRTTRLPSIKAAASSAAILPAGKVPTELDRDLRGRGPMLLDRKPAGNLPPGGMRHHKRRPFLFYPTHWINPACERFPRVRRSRSHRPGGCHRIAQRPCHIPDPTEPRPLRP